MITNMMTVGNLQRALKVGITGVYITDRKSAEIIFVDFVALADMVSDVIEKNREGEQSCSIAQ